jgi:hypothetical protein
MWLILKKIVSTVLNRRVFLLFVAYVRAVQYLRMCREECHVKNNEL